MTATAIPPQSDPGGYVQAWSESFSHVLGQIAGTPVPCAIGQEAEPAAENDLWAVCTGSGALRGEQSFRIPAESAARLAQRFMSEAENPETPLTPEHGEAVVELLRQVAGMVATALRPRWGEVQFRLDPGTGPPSWPPSATFCLRCGEENSSLVVELQMSAALVAALRSERPEAASSPSPPVSASAPATAQQRVQLDQLMDVELAMTLRFGSRQVPLREILEFCPGTVIELDRQVNEPVDLLLHGKLVARGEVVVVDGNYGLRVTEVVSAGG